MVPISNLVLAVLDIRLFPRYLFSKRFTRYYYIEEERKSKIRIFFDLVWWFFRWGEVNNLYYLYGLDTRRR